MTLIRSEVSWFNITPTTVCTRVNEGLLEAVNLLHNNKRQQAYQLSLLLTQKTHHKSVKGSRQDG